MTIVIELSARIADGFIMKTPELLSALLFAGRTRFFSAVVLFVLATGSGRYRAALWNLVSRPKKGLDAK